MVDAPHPMYPVAADGTIDIVQVWTIVNHMLSKSAAVELITEYIAGTGISPAKSDSAPIRFTQNDATGPATHALAFLLDAALDSPFALARARYESVDLWNRTFRQQTGAK